MVVIEDILIAASEKLKLTIYHELYLGTEAMIGRKLLDVSPIQKNLIAVVTGFDEYTNISGYTSFTIGRIVFATLADTNKQVIQRLPAFKTILYPLYENYLKLICLQPGIIERDWQLIQTTKRNLYGEVPATDKVSEVLDAIEILNFRNKISINNC
jgi:hypothetical protein